MASGDLTGATVKAHSPGPVAVYTKENLETIAGAVRVGLFMPIAQSTRVSGKMTSGTVRGPLLGWMVHLTQECLEMT